MFKHILVPLDGCVLAECVLPHVMALAQVFGASCTVLRVLKDDRDRETGRSIDPLEWHLREATAEAYLIEVEQRLKAAGVETEHVLLKGQPASRIVQYAHDHETDLIVLSSHGRSGLSPWNVNSVVQKTVQLAGCSTMIVRAYRSTEEDLGDLRYRRILLPLDGSRRAEFSLPVAMHLAQQHDTELVIAHVVTEPEMPRRAPRTHQEVELLEQLTETNRRVAVRYLDQLQSRLQVDSDTRLIVSDDVVASLHNIANSEEIDLMIMSAHGYSGKTQRPYGRVTTNFISYGTSPLLIVQDLAPEEVKPSETQALAKSRQALSALPLGSRGGGTDRSARKVPLLASD